MFRRRVVRILFPQPMNPARIVVILCIVQFSGYPIVLAQRFLTTFGAVTELKTNLSSLGLMTGDFDGDGKPDVASYSANQVQFFFGDSNPLIFRPATFTPVKPVNEAISVRSNHDRFTDILVITDQRQTFLVYLGRSKAKFILSWTYHSPVQIDQCIVGDINGDRKSDIIIFGKKMLGVTVFLGNDNGTFRKPATIFQDYSLSALLVTSIHDNGIIDVIASNWISNQIMVFSGFGNMKFSDPSIIPCLSEPMHLETAYLDSDLNVDIITTFADPPSVAIYKGNGLGEFHFSQTIRFDNDITEMSIADINGDGQQDIVLLIQENSSVDILLNNGEGKVGEKVKFATTTSPIGLVLLHHSKLSCTDAAVLDTAQSLLRIFVNARMPIVNVSDRSLAVGKSPTGTITLDIDHDGWEDILVANTTTMSISLFMNCGKGIFSGQISFDVPAPPSVLHVISKNDSTALVISTHRGSENISLLELNLHNYSHTSYALPLQGDAEVFSAKMDSSERYLHMYSTEYDRATSQTAFVEFEQVTSTRFIERTVPLQAPGPVTCVTLGDFNGDNLPDLAYCVSDKKSHTQDLLQSLGNLLHQFDPPIVISSFTDSNGTVSALWHGDLNDDGKDDLIANMTGSDNSLYVFFNPIDSTRPQSIRIPNPIIVSNTDKLKIIDVNNDAINDIVLENSINHAVEVYLGHLDESFESPKQLVIAESIGGFDIADVNNDNIPDLLMTDASNGFLKIISLEKIKWH